MKSVQGDGPNTLRDVQLITPLQANDFDCWSKQTQRIAMGSRPVSLQSEAEFSRRPKPLNCWRISQSLPTCCQKYSTSNHVSKAAIGSSATKSN